MNKRGNIITIDIIYNQDSEVNDGRPRIFGSSFVENNKNKCKIIYKDEEHELKEYLDEIDDDYQDETI